VKELSTLPKPPSWIYEVGTLPIPSLREAARGRRKTTGLKGRVGEEEEKVVLNVGVLHRIIHNF